ncbi:hypothetical protein HanRHA438_Chr05g0217981 [Helianthus annuus]|uniref:Secreted protein n=1 Tax=Helianthus annuus TaxID=4232 RepID=A0A251UN95_HELAN|nr:hypothetical protein HanXRQr2_Chr05g0208501 [Helianthus annuus]KAJ0918439.1 hypothetical protein HanRHA438_Chr05g0217981 [Helianthus annuus]
MILYPLSHNNLHFLLCILCVFHSVHLRSTSVPPFLTTDPNCSHHRLQPPPPLATFQFSSVSVSVCMS